ncbi:DUF4145 domain-containing protein [Priestia megaterium]|uniref:DUF4145 domain-containing protein n=1 Tax=Priestia megaterium TaxID=1404 RepID=UPI0035DEEBAB
MSKLIMPSYREKAFNCARCEVLTPHQWFDIVEPKYHGDAPRVNEIIENKAVYYSAGPVYDTPVVERTENDWDLELSVCQHCHQYTIWENEKIIYPSETGLPAPHKDMFDPVREIYQEAALIFNDSPRAAAALLRLAIETMIPLLDDYQVKKGNLNNMIGDLVGQGVPEYIQQSLDTIRIYGNEGIHSGEIVMKDNQETVSFMFEVINNMVEELITRKNKIKEAYSKIPSGKIEAIFKRDNKIEK